jgi:polyphosphate kinase
VETTQELSWLRFNRRVLDQTHRRDFPVLERLRFLSIWASNQDEFFAARVTRPFLENRGSDAYLAILGEASQQSELAARTYEDFLPELGRMGIRLVSAAELTLEEKMYFGAYLAEEVVPRTDVIRADELRNIRSQALYFACGGAALHHLVRMPDGVPRALQIPGRPGSYVRLGELLRMRPDLFVPGKVSRIHELRAIRLAAIDRDPDDWSDLPAALESRLDGRISHLEVERGFPAFWRETVRLAAGLQAPEVMQVSPPLDLRFVSQLVSEGPGEGKFKPLQIRHARRFERGPFERIRQGDVVLFHPYHSYDAVEAFVRTAAADPAVRAIRSTLYRVGDDNVIAAALIEAASAGKDVAVLLEGRARFDELTNMEWALRFRNSGVRVLRLLHRKVHAKLCWVEREDGAYVHLGTGNYNPVNGRLYTDFSLFTRDPRLTADARSFFGALESGTAPALQAMRTSRGIRDLLLERIGAEAHPGGHVIFKVNHLTDPEILDALESCASAGARVDVIVRTTVVRIDHGVRTRSIVGRFLEHARAVAFRRGGEWEVWAGSFDAMPRAFERRYELMFPMADPRARRMVLHELRAQLRDDVNAYELGVDGAEAPRRGGKHDCQHPEHRLPRPPPLVAEPAEPDPRGPQAGGEAQHAFSG